MKQISWTVKVVEILLLLMLVILAFAECNSEWDYIKAFLICVCALFSVLAQSIISSEEFSKPL